MLFREKSIQQFSLLCGFCDIHSHLLNDVDDGSQSADESLAALSWLEQQGVTTLWLTPHIMEDMPNQTQALKQRFEKLSALYTGSVHLRLAAEYMLDTLFRQRYQANDLLPLAESYLLVETSCLTPPLGLDSLLFNICNGRYRPILAHPERYLYMQGTDYEKLKDRGICFQLNLMSLAGMYGREACRKAHGLLKKGLYDFAGTDVHRLPALEKAVKKRCISPAEVRLLQQVAENNKQL